jgi:UDP-N-acetylmuramoyl-L-alanyl-D-glutamate--2,6-diaminopimelate ligase
MEGVNLSHLVREGFASGVRGDGTVRVTGIRHDSRRVEPGDLFVAIPGVHHDGADYIGDALRRGAAAVLSERSLDLEIPSLTAENALVALSDIARRLYGDPTSSLPVVGVTGTNGKTTTTFLLEAMLTAAGGCPAVIGTVNFRGPQGTLPATHTTPMADDLMRLARDAVDGGASHLILEVSSHALAMHRADGVHFAAAALTNLTQDHLDYHGDFASYERAKRRLFEELDPGVSVLNVDDDLGARLARELSGRILRCSRKGDADAEVRARSWCSDRTGITAVVETPSGALSVQSPLVGDHNLENILLALGCGLALGIESDRLVEGLRGFGGAPGRLERIVDPRQVLVAVDYAHTPDALDRVLAALRPITDRRLLVVFGCGGDRDRQKRPLMGEAASRRADLLVLTSDNPRSETPERILDQIEQGVRGTGLRRIEEADLRSHRRGYIVEPDRRRAIDLAVAAAGPGDTVLIAGKGHETVQIVGDRRNPFDDRIEARRAVEAAVTG